MKRDFFIIVSILALCTGAMLFKDTLLPMLSKWDAFCLGMIWGSTMYYLQLKLSRR